MTDENFILAIWVEASSIFCLSVAEILSLFFEADNLFSLVITSFLPLLLTHLRSE